jgi:hypothetical protein
MINPTGNAAFSGRMLAALLMLVITVLLLVFLAARARRGRRPYVRPIPAFDALPTQLGLAAEQGASLHVALGSGGIGGERTITSLAGLQALEAIAKPAVLYGTPPVVTVGDATLLPLAQDVLRRACARAGIPERYQPTSVRFVAPSPVVYALGAADSLSHEPITGNLLAGAFAEEAVLLAAAGEKKGLTQEAATDQLRALGALYPTDATLAIGEELYAAGARLTARPEYLASLSTQDVLRFLLVALLILAALGVRLF